MILTQQHKVVPEIKIGLLRVELIECAATHMIHMRTRAIHHFVTDVLHSPAKVDLLHVRKKILIQSSCFSVSRSTHKKACSGCPEYLPLIIVLAAVLLKAIEHAAPAKRETEFINEPSCRTGLLELFAFIVRKYFGRAGSNIRIRIHQRNNGLQPFPCYLHIRIEQHKILVRQST